MSKASRSTRCSKWETSNNALQKLYFHNGKRVEYNELSDSEKKLVKNEKKNVAKVLFTKLKDKETRQVIDNGRQITIHFTSRVLDHFANDAMILLTSKYFNKKTMMRVNEILESSVYVPTSHTLKKTRTDGRDMWFKYSENEERYVFFKVC